MSVKNAVEEREAHIKSLEKDLSEAKKADEKKVIENLIKEIKKQIDEIKGIKEKSVSVMPIIKIKEELKEKVEE